MSDRNDRQSEILFRAITDLPDERVEEAMPPVRAPARRPAWKAPAALAACLVLILGFNAFRLGFFGHTGGAAGRGGEASGQVYMSYAGPVFPLSALGAPDLTAVRCVDFDFSPYAPHEETDPDENGRPGSFTAWRNQAVVTDSYTLTNPEENVQTVTLLYPFAASLSDGPDRIPAVTVDGQAADTVLHIGPTAEGYRDLFADDPDAADQPWNLIDLSAWTSYRTLIGAGYQDRAMEPAPVPDLPVTVYRLTDCAPPEGYQGEFFDLAVVSRPGARVLTWGFNFGFRDEMTGQEGRGCGIAADGANRSVPTLIVLDGGLEDCTVRAFAGGTGRETPLEGAKWSLGREETTLSAVLNAIAAENLKESRQYGEKDNILSTLSPAGYTDLAERNLSDLGVLTGDPAQLYGGGMLEELFTANTAADRVLYLSFEVTLPARGTAEVTASMIKPASFDFTGKDKNRNGYDLVTRLGSPLAFTAQTATISNPDWVEIIAQNFGFDPEAGVTSVTLDPGQEHYYLDVVRRTAPR